MGYVAVSGSLSNNLSLLSMMKIPQAYESILFHSRFTLISKYNIIKPTKILIEDPPAGGRCIIKL